MGPSHYQYNDGCSVFTSIVIFGPRVPLKFTKHDMSGTRAVGCRCLLYDMFHCAIAQLQMTTLIQCFSTVSWTTVRGDLTMNYVITQHKLSKNTKKYISP